MGDSFSSASFEKYFQARKSVEYNGYVKDHFDTSGFFGNFLQDNPSMLSRMTNLLIHAMDTRFNGKLLPLPKLIVIVPDDDFIKQLCPGNIEHAKGISKPLSRMLNFVMTEFERSIAAFKEYLPAKSV